MCFKYHLFSLSFSPSVLSTRQNPTLAISIVHILISAWHEQHSDSILQLCEGDKKCNKTKMPALLSPRQGLGLNRSHGLTQGGDNTMEMEPCFCNTFNMKETPLKGH